MEMCHSQLVVSTLAASLACHSWLLTLSAVLYRLERGVNDYLRVQGHQVAGVQPEMR